MRNIAMSHSLSFGEPTLKPVFPISKSPLDEGIYLEETILWGSGPRGFVLRGPDVGGSERCSSVGIECEARGYALSPL